MTIFLVRRIPDVLLPTTCVNSQQWTVDDFEYRPYQSGELPSGLNSEVARTTPVKHIHAVIAMLPNREPSLVPVSVRYSLEFKAV